MNIKKFTISVEGFMILGMAILISGIIMLHNVNDVKSKDIEHGHVVKDFHEAVVNNAVAFIKSKKHDSKSSESIEDISKTYSADKEIEEIIESILEEMQKAYDDNDFVALTGIIPKVMLSGSRQAKEEMISDLVWFGTKSIPDLIPFLNDPDYSIRNNAFDSMNSLIKEITEEDEMAEKVALLMKSDVQMEDEDMEEIAMDLNTINDNSIIVSTVIDIMENGKSELGKKWAQDSYEFATGETWESKERALQWIAENEE